MDKTTLPTSGLIPFVSGMSKFLVDIGGERANRLLNLLLRKTRKKINEPTNNMQVVAPTQVGPDGQPTKENNMNYDKIKQKLFEVVSKEDMPCNKPRASTRPGKKKMVKACEGGKEKIVHFGAKGYGNNYSSKARKSFKARHKCSEKKSKLSAQYWACKNLWAGPKGSKTSCPAGRQCKY